MNEGKKEFIALKEDVGKRFAVCRFCESCDCFGLPALPILLSQEGMFLERLYCISNPLEDSSDFVMGTVTRNRHMLCKDANPNGLCEAYTEAAEEELLRREKLFL